VSATTPSRSLKQRMDALEKGTAIRMANAQIKREMKVRHLDLSGAIKHPSVGSLKVLTLLQYVPGVGRVKALKILGVLGISPAKRVDGLSARQREMLVAWAQRFDRRWV
jgi:S13-like protein